MDALMIAAILQLFLIAMTQNDRFRQTAPGFWLPLGIAIIGMTFAGSLLV